MRLTIKGVDVELKYSIRMYMLFESANGGRSFKGGNLTDELLLFLSCIWGANRTVSIGLDDLIEAVDDNPLLLSSWRSWLSEQIERQNALMSPVEESECKKKD